MGLDALCPRVERRARGKGLVLDEDVVKALVVLGRSAEYRVLEERECKHVCGSELAEEIVAPITAVGPDSEAPPEALAHVRMWDAYAVPIYRFCFRRTGDGELAEDLTSIVFLEAFAFASPIAGACATASLRRSIG